MTETFFPSEVCAMRRSAAAISGRETRHPHGSGAGRQAGARAALVLALGACGADTQREPVPPAGGALGGAAAPGAESEASNDGASGASAESAPEALSPDAIENVSAGGQGGGADGARPPPQPSSGCGALLLVASGEQQLQVDGALRTYVLDVPAGYAGSAPLPLVFAFHGATTSGALFRSPFYGDLLSTMRDEAIVVHPDALGDPSAWSTGSDLPFFDALLAELGAGLCVDQGRVFATGHSSGGFFTNALGCQRGDVLRAIAPVSAGGPFTFGGDGCRGDVAVWLAHAENDETVPFESGLDSRDRWLSTNGCSSATEAAPPGPCVEHTGCAQGLPVRWCVYDEGHAWPAFGPEGIWAFFGSF